MTAAARIVPAGTIERLEALRTAALDSSDTVGRARALLYLVNWIERARYATDTLDAIFECDRELHAQLQGKGLAPFPVWEEDDSAGVQWLLMHIGTDLLGGIEQRLDDARKASHIG